MYASLAGKTDVSPKVAAKFVGPKAHAEGGIMKKESPAMMKKEVAFMKKKGAPKSMLKHEMREMADKGGRAMKNRTADKMGRAMVKNKKMAGGGMAYSDGGSVYRKGADGVASKGKTKGKMVRMMKGGYCG